MASLGVEHAVNQEVVSSVAVEGMKLAFGFGLSVW